MCSRNSLRHRYELRSHCDEISEPTRSHASKALSRDMGSRSLSGSVVFVGKKCVDAWSLCAMVVHNNPVLCPQTVSLVSWRLEQLPHLYFVLALQVPVPTLTVLQHGHPSGKSQSLAKVDRSHTGVDSIGYMPLIKMYNRTCHFPSPSPYVLPTSAATSSGVFPYARDCPPCQYTREIRYNVS